MSGHKYTPLPKLIYWLVKRLCREAYQDEVLGDLEELFHWRLESKGLASARFRLFLDAFSAIRLIRIENKTTVKLNFLTMISLKVTIRTFLRNKLHTSINLFGLACGFMVFLAIYQYVSFERGYDTLISQSDQVYRITNTLKKESSIVYTTAESLPPMGREAKEAVPGVLAYVKLFNAGAQNSCVITLGHDLSSSFKEQKILFATQGFPELMQLSMIEGTPGNVLDQPNEVIISKSMQEKYFQGASALGRTLIFDDDDENHHNLTVSGVYQDHPGNSHLEFDMLISFKTLYTRDGRADKPARFHFDEDWEGRHYFATYLKLEPGTDHRQVTETLEAKANAAISYPGYAYDFELMPIRDIHLSEGMRGDVKPVADADRLNTLLILAVSVLVLAWVNFVNLTTATALGRAKETGMRKVLGGTRAQLVWQFLFESLFTGILAFGLGLLLFSLTFPYFNEFLPVTEKWFFLQHMENAILIVVIALGSSLLAGIYPALVLSGFRPATVLKGKFRTSKKGLLVRRILVVFQASISIFLITGLVAIVQQVDYMTDNDLGMETEQVVVIEKPGNLSGVSVEEHDLKGLFRAQLEGKSFVSGYAVTDGLPGSRLRKGRDINLTENEENEIDAWSIHVEYDYLSVLDIPVLEGRDFRSADVDVDKLIVNEAAVYALGLSAPSEILNKRLYDGDNWKTVVGVIANYHHTSLKDEMVPMIIGTRSRGMDYHMIKVNGGSLAANMVVLEEAFGNVFPGNPFEYYFLDDHFAENYKGEQRFGKSFAFFAAIAMLIAGIGLFSLSSFITMSRTKEIGIRKVLGARAMAIVNQLNREFVMLVILAAVIATPVSAWLVEGWLSDFPYRITPGLLFFLLPTVILMAFCLMSVSLKTIAASRLNPVKLLRAE